MNGYNNYNNPQQNNNLTMDQLLSTTPINNIQTNTHQPKKKKTKLLIFIILFILIAAGCIIGFILLNKDKEKDTEEDVVEEVKHYSWSGLYTNGADSVKIYQIDENKLYFDINTEESRAYATANITGNKAEGKIYAIYSFELEDDKLKVTTTDDYMLDATYTKTGEYSKDNVYIDNYGEPEYLNTIINGVFYNEKKDATVTVYQTHADKAYLYIQVGENNYTKEVTVVDNEIKFYEELYENTINIDISFTKDTLNLQIKTTDRSSFLRRISGKYKKTKSITMDELLDERLN